MTEEEVIILTDDEMPPYCEGCFNEQGSCGTPCAQCSKAAAYEVMIIRVLHKKHKGLKRNSHG